MLKYPFLILLFTILFCFCATMGRSQDTLLLRDGKKVICKVLEITPAEIKYKLFSNLQGPIYIENKFNVSSIIYSNGSKEIIEPDPVQVYKKKLENETRYGFPLDSILDKKKYTKNTVFIEILGNGAYYYSDENFYSFGTINYERAININKNRWNSIRIGFTAAYHTRPDRNNDQTHNTFTFNIPLIYNFISNSRGANHFESGVGILYYFERDPYIGYSHQVGITGNIGYRYQRNKKAGLYISVCYTPCILPSKIIVGDWGSIARIISGGLRLGYHF